jgi:DNA-binding HxlR family transcriptional regulator
VKINQTGPVMTQERSAGPSGTDDAVTRELMASLSDKWSLWAMSVLATATVPMRYTRLMERIDGITQAALTKTLRQLERDGLVTRQMYPEVPPRVEYAITPLGADLVQHIEPLWLWVAGSASVFQAARQRFDGKTTGMRAVAGAIPGTLLPPRKPAVRERNKQQ